MTEEKQQRYPDSCGACALLCAAIELGKNQPPDVGANPNPLPAVIQPAFAALPDADVYGWDGGNAFTADDAGEDAIYYVTSGGTLAGYSMPSTVCHAALALGLEVDVYLGTWIRRRSSLPPLTRAYPNEITTVENMNVSIYKRGWHYLKNNQRALCIVVRPNGGLHYLMRRPNGSFMDPDTGANHTWHVGRYHSDPVTKKKIPTTYTGISLVLTG